MAWPTRVLLDRLRVLPSVRLAPLTYLLYDCNGKKQRGQGNAVDNREYQRQVSAAVSIEAAGLSPASGVQHVMDYGKADWRHREDCDRRYDQRPRSWPTRFEGEEKADDSSEPQADGRTDRPARQDRLFSVADACPSAADNCSAHRSDKRYPDNRRLRLSSDKCANGAEHEAQWQCQHRRRMPS
jgi:hypothetical protein